MQLCFYFCTQHLLIASAQTLSDAAPSRCCGQSFDVRFSFNTFGDTLQSALSEAVGPDCLTRPLAWWHCLPDGRRAREVLLQPVPAPPVSSWSEAETRLVRLLGTQFPVVRVVVKTTSNLDDESSRSFALSLRM